MESVTVRVPASTSNCGPGFDTLGLALSLYNEVRVSPNGGASTHVVNVRGQGPHSGEDLARQASSEFFRVTGIPAHGIDFSVEGNVPPARGLGSSVTLLGGVVAALDRMHGTRLPREDLAAMVTRIEGHPDNATASLLGGFCVSRFCDRTRDLCGVIRREMPSDLAFAVVSPIQEMLTKEARGVLPQTISHAQAVRNVNAVSWLVAALFAGDWANLRMATEDHLHQPFRLPRIKGATEAISAGMAAGAYGGWLSGSGSSVLCIAEGGAAREILRAMEASFDRLDLRCESHLLQADNEGFAVLD